MKLPWMKRSRTLTHVDVVDLPERHVDSYLVCLEPWSPEMAEAGDHKARWYRTAREQGLRVKVALDAQDNAIGMIQYGPIELGPADGDGLFMILCIWVHGHDEGVGDVQGVGIGTALLEAAEDDARARGATGMVAWGLRLPVWMKSAWFLEHGYVLAQRVAMRDLVWKPFVDDAGPPRWVDGQRVSVGSAGQVDVTAYLTGWCPAANVVYERARRAADELGPDVTFTTVDTSDRATMLACGHSDEVFVGGKPLQRGAPPSYATIRRRMQRQLRRARRRAPARTD